MKKPVEAGCLGDIFTSFFLDFHSASQKSVNFKHFAFFHKIIYCQKSPPLLGFSGIDQRKLKIIEKNIKKVLMKLDYLLYNIIIESWKRNQLSKNNKLKVNNMNNLRMIDLVSNNFKNPQSAVVANTIVSLANDMNKQRLTKAKAKHLSNTLRESADIIASLEAKIK